MEAKDNFDHLYKSKHNYIIIENHLPAERKECTNQPKSAKMTTVSRENPIKRELK